MSLLEIPHHEQVYQHRMAAMSEVKARLLTRVAYGSQVLDYGCGAGDVVASAHRLRPDLTFVGFDSQPSAVQAARKKRIPQSRFHLKESDAFMDVLTHPGPKVLFLSSVIHEIASAYGHEGFLSVLDKASAFDTVVIRDMAYEEATEHLEDAVPDALTGTRWTKEFAEKWGVPNTVPKVAHLMLKSRYTDNWDAEMLENYFAYSAENLCRTVKARFPVSSHHMHEVPTFLENEFRTTFGRGPLTCTHLEAVFHRS